MDIFLWAKILHVFFVVTWIATVFSLPQILLGLAGAEHRPVVCEAKLQSGRRIYLLGHNLFGAAFSFGLVLWLYFGIGGAWLHLKLVLVTLLLTDYTISGRWLKGAVAGRALPLARLLWWYSQVPAILLLAILWLVLAKPFHSYE